MKKKRNAATRRLTGPDELLLLLQNLTDEKIIMANHFKINIHLEKQAAGLIEVFNLIEPWWMEDKCDVSHTMVTDLAAIRIKLRYHIIKQAQGRFRSGVFAKQVYTNCFEDYQTIASFCATLSTHKVLPAETEENLYSTLAARDLRDAMAESILWILVGVVSRSLSVELPNFTIRNKCLEMATEIKKSSPSGSIVCKQAEHFIKETQP